MDKFCSVCGSKLDETTHQCPNCNKTTVENVNDITSVSSAAVLQMNDGDVVTNTDGINPVPDNTIPKPVSSKPVKISKSPSVNIKEKKEKKNSKSAILVIMISLIIVIAAVITVLIVSGVVSNPFGGDSKNSVSQNSMPADDGKPFSKPSDKDDDDFTLGSYDVEIPDAKEYYEQNADLISEIKADDSDDVTSGEGTYEMLEERGFSESVVIAKYSMSGDYIEDKEISSYSSEEYPMYETKYIAQNGDVWAISVVNGQITAVSMAYIDEYEKIVVISEKDTITNYDSTTNTFFVNKPKDDVIVKVVDKIDTATLDALDAKEIDKL